MARKRMISPEIWENQGFGELSILAKILFIGMISQADDDGKGVLSAPLLKSKILPYDNVRIADIEKALQEIGHSVSTKPGARFVPGKADTKYARQHDADHNLSTVFYEIEGKEYYLFENWRKWQTINRPIPSKLPNPQSADGEGEGIHSDEVFSDNSVSTHTQFSEYSRPIEYIKENNNIPPYSACVDEEFTGKLKAFCKKWDIAIDTNSSLIANLDFVKLDKAYSESKTLLQDKQKAPYAHTLSWVVKNATSIYAKKYKDRSGGSKSRASGTVEILQKLFDAERLAEEGSNEDS